MPDPELPSDPAPTPARSSAWEGPAIGLACLLVVAGGSWWLLSSPAIFTETVPVLSKFERAPVDPNYARYVDEQSCRECHPGESAAHSRSGHSKTLRLASRVESARKLDGREVADPERPGVIWKYEVRDGQLATTRVEEGRAERFLIEYALGSRRHAMTFASLLKRDPASPSVLEHRLTHFATDDALGLTPGQSAAAKEPGNTPHGWVVEPGNTLKCFGCHVTVMSDKGPSFLDEKTMIPNVSCQRCHGPAKEHVESARRGATGAALVSLPRLAESSALDEMKACGQCHRTPEMVPPQQLNVGNASIARLQPVGLMQSACFVKSEGKLRCSTCHEPHSRTSTDRAAYQAQCLDCHQSTEQARCSVSPLDGCVDCHMPKRDVGRGMMMSDHWIRIIPEPAAPAQPPAGR